MRNCSKNLVRHGNGHEVMVSEMGSLKGSVMRPFMRLVMWSVMGLVKRLVMRSVCLYNVKKCLELP